MIMDQQGIKISFFKYYAKLYKSQKINTEKMEKYLQKMTPPKVMDEIKNIKSSN